MDSLSVEWLQFIMDAISPMLRLGTDCIRTLLGLLDLHSLIVLRQACREMRRAVSDCLRAGELQFCLVRTIGRLGDAEAARVSKYGISDDQLFHPQQAVRIGSSVLIAQRHESAKGGAQCLRLLPSEPNSAPYDFEHNLRALPLHRCLKARLPYDLAVDETVGAVYVLDDEPWERSGAQVRDATSGEVDAALAATKLGHTGLGCKPLAVAALDGRVCLLFPDWALIYNREGQLCEYIDCEYIENAASEGSDDNEGCDDSEGSDEPSPATVLSSYCAVDLTLLRDDSRLLCAVLAAEDKRLLQGVTRNRVRFFDITGCAQPTIDIFGDPFPGHTRSQFVREWPSNGVYACGLCADAHGVVYVSECDAHWQGQVCAFTHTGQLLARFPVYNDNYRVERLTQGRYPVQRRRVSVDQQQRLLLTQGSAGQVLELELRLR